MSWWERYKVYLDVLETGGSWFVERDARTVALLTDPQYVDMFWYAWRIEPIVESEAERAALFSQAYWDPLLLARTVFRSREYNAVVEAFWAGEDPIRDGRLVMRALYHPIREPWLWDHFVLWLRRHWSKQVSGK